MRFDKGEIVKFNVELMNSVCYKGYAKLEKVDLSVNVCRITSLFPIEGSAGGTFNIIHCALDEISKLDDKDFETLEMLLIAGDYVVQCRGPGEI